MDKPRELGIKAGMAGEDPRSCPYPKMTIERYVWERWHGWGVEIAGEYRRSVDALNKVTDREISLGASTPPSPEGS